MSHPGRSALWARRDQAESAFAGILADLVSRTPGARAAALVDVDGETVDYACGTDPFDVRLAAAHLRIVLGDLQRHRDDAQAVALRCATRSYLVRALPHGYALVLVLTCGSSRVALARGLPLSVSRLCTEAGWAAPPRLYWYPIEVEVDERGRPIRLRTSGEFAAQVEILGTIAGGLARFERGWRVRLAGREATVVREPSGHWYIDDSLR